MAEIKRLEGVLVVLTTPLNADESVDEPALRKLLRRVLAGGVHGVVALGSAGEFAALADEQKRRVIRVTVEEVNGAVPVIAGTGEPGTRRAVAMTQTARALGADAALVVPPYYSRVNDEAVLCHYRTVAREGGLPVLLYNIPAFTKVDLSLATVQALADEPNIVGIKDSSANLNNFRRLTSSVRSEKFTVVTGSDGMLFAQLVCGGDGCISPGSNVVPEWFVGLWDAFRDGRWTDAWEIQIRIEALHRGIGYGSFPAGIKGALSLLGIGAPTLTSPNVPVSNDQLAAIGTTLREHGLLT